MLTSRKCLGWLLLSVVMFCGLATAQIGGGSIVGSITDQSGSAIVAATVTATNTGTNVTRSTVTNEAGYYEFPLLPAGSYRIEAMVEGFQRAYTAEFELNSGTRPRFDLSLKVGQVAEAVEVVSEAPLVNTTSTELGVVIDQNKVQELPLNGRNWQQLVGLQAGVVASPGNSVGNRGGMEFNGSSAFGNNLMMDGVDMSFGENAGSASDEAAGSGGGGSRVNTVSVEAIQEFKTTGSAFSAEYGRATGGVVNVVTKSGTNDFHGTLFHFLRNDKLDANDFFSNRSGFQQPPLRWNQFGGNVGGPVKKDSLFFFFNYEGARIRRNEAITGNVATPALLGMVTPALRQTLERMPTSFEPTNNALIGFHRRNDQRENNENTYLSRVDWNLGAHRLTGRYSYNRQDFLSPTIMETVDQIYPTRFHNAVLQDGWTLGPTMFNEFRFGVNKLDLDRRYNNAEDVPAWFQTAGVNLNLTFGARIHFMTDTYTIADNFTLIRGKHSVKAGFEYRRVNASRFQDNVPNHFYNSLNDLIADRTNRTRIVFGGPKDLSNSNIGIYIQDDYRVTQRLQLNMGLRYEYFPPITGLFNITGSDPYGAFGSMGDPMTRPDRNNFGPRLGLVYDVLGNQKLVVRAGGGISYVPPTFMLYFDYAFLDPRIPFNPIIATGDLPSGISSTYPFDSSFIPAVIQDPSLLPSDLVLSRSVTDFNARDEYAGQWNLSVQSAITPKLAVQASYVGSRILNQSGVRWLNLNDPVTKSRPDPTIGDIYVRENAGRSSYHALQLSANRRVGNGLTFDLYYTWARTMTYFGADSTVTRTNSAVQDPFNIAGSYGPKAGEIRHRTTGVVSWAVPVPESMKRGWQSTLLAGWNLQGITGWRSGLPLNVTAGTDLVGNGYVDGQRPDLVPGVDPYNRDLDALTWLNPAAFDNAGPKAAKRYGSLGYNALRGPNGFTLDAALHKQFRIAEGHRLTFRFEMFNALNHPVFNGPNTNANNPNFGRILGSSGGRNIQFALKYNF